jgi:predicted Fe-Mo cluster-binding NifX family protein
MKIAITTSGDNLAAPVDPRFGRAKAFIIYDTDSGEWSVLDNTQNLNAAQGAGVQSATNVVSTGAAVLITGNCGPRGFATLSAGNVKVLTGAAGTVQEAIDQFKAGGLQEADGANVGSHFGMGI